MRTVVHYYHVVNIRYNYPWFYRFVIEGRGDQRIIPYPHERGPTTEYQPTSHLGLNFLLKSIVYSNMRLSVAALETAAQMAGLWALNIE